MTDQIERNKNLVHAYIDAINKHNWDRLDEIVSTDFIRHSYAAGEPAVRCRGDLIQFLRTQEKIFPKFEDHILDLVVEGNKVAARHRFKGSQLGAMGSYPASFREMDIEYLAIYRIEKDAIVEAWVEWDNYTSMKQLGHLNMIQASE